jgi:hypothetical protein
MDVIGRDPMEKGNGGVFYGPDDSLEDVTENMLLIENISGFGASPSSIKTY